MGEEASSNIQSNSPETAVSHPTESIYPFQELYGDLQGLTPPPEDLDELLNGYQSPEVSIQQFKLSAEPPTPPRTETASTPASSSGSGGSSPTKRESLSPGTSPPSPDSDAVMENELEYLGLKKVPHEYLDPVSNINIDLLPISPDYDHDLEDMIDLNDFAHDNPFFDFNSAASSPGPPSHAKSVKPQTPLKVFGDRALSQPSQRQPIAGRGLSRKRSREDTHHTDIGEDHGGSRSSPADIKFEFSTVPQSSTLEFVNLSTEGYNFQATNQNPGFNFDPMFQPPTVQEPLQPSMAPLLPVGHFAPKLNLVVDFPVKNSEQQRSPVGFGEAQVKSRVETQISVRFMLISPPPGILKLRLPRHAISKIKYIEDNHPTSSPDTLNLQATVVCASAMALHDQLHRALCEARDEPIPSWILEEQSARLAMERAGTDSITDQGVSLEMSAGGREERRPKIDYSKPLFGASVQICEQCMNRERKRASRKKNKKPEEEEKWAQDERKRIVVFNTNQVRQFSPITGPGEATAIASETQMRICCYCRHHGEKDGFRVIFTLRDHTGAVVAQTMSSTILITDDHKTNSSVSTASAAVTSPQPSHSDSITMQSESPKPNVGFASGFVPSMSTAQEAVSLHSFSQSNFLPGNQLGQSLSPSPDRQTKRRKSARVPASLAMTPSDPSLFNNGQYGPSGISATPRSSGMDNNSPWMSGPTTPMAQLTDDTNYFNNMSWSPSVGVNGFGTLASPPPSHVSSRARYFGQQMGSSMMPLQGLALESTPHVHRVIPNEGTCRGGVEITVLGRNFVNGLTVTFGEIAATDTSFYSDSTLLCRLPPNPNPGSVIVALKNIESSFRAESIPLFTYIDDVEKELMALALTVVGMKMKGEVGTSKDIALSILRDNGIGLDAVESTRDNGIGNQKNPLEATLLACLDVIDMDESPHPANLGHKNKSGQTMLHLACMLGMSKFVAGLLARGMNPNSRDKNGYTPLHFAALYKRSDVARRLLMHRADAGLRTRGGETAADLGESSQIVEATRSVHEIRSRQHSRSSSMSSESRFGKSRSNSMTSMVAKLPGSMTRNGVDDFYDPKNPEQDNGSFDNPDGSDDQVVWKSTRDSIPGQGTVEKPPVKQDNRVESMAAAAVGTPAVMAAWMEAWRDQLAQSLQSLQLNIPTIPAAVDYQTLFQNHMAKFQNPMHRWNNFKLGQREDPDYKWSELFHPPAPPAYEELYPQGNISAANDNRQDQKALPVEECSSESVAACVSISRSPTVSPTPSSIDLRELHRQLTHTDKFLTEAQQAEYRAHVRKIKRIESDRRLYFFWIPILIVIIAMMGFTHVSNGWSAGKSVIDFFQDVFFGELQSDEQPFNIPTPLSFSVIKDRIKDRIRFAIGRALGFPVA